jgi:hypothetical protein
MYPQNYIYTVGSETYTGVYVNPVSQEPYLLGNCNYSPKFPCARENLYSQTVIESKPYNPKEFGTMNKIANFLSDLVAGQNAEVSATLNTANISLTADEISAIENNFTAIL